MQSSPMTRVKSGLRTGKVSNKDGRQDHHYVEVYDLSQLPTVDESTKSMKPAVTKEDTEIDQVPTGEGRGLQWSGDQVSGSRKITNATFGSDLSDSSSDQDVSPSPVGIISIVNASLKLMLVRLRVIGMAIL